MNNIYSLLQTLDQSKNALVRDFSKEARAHNSAISFVEISLFSLVKTETGINRFSGRQSYFTSDKMARTLCSLLALSLVCSVWSQSQDISHLLPKSASAVKGEVPDHVKEKVLLDLQAGRLLPGDFTQINTIFNQFNIEATLSLDENPIPVDTCFGLCFYLLAYVGDSATCFDFLVNPTGDLSVTAYQAGTEQIDFITYQK